MLSLSLFFSPENSCDNVSINIFPIWALDADSWPRQHHQGIKHYAFVGAVCSLRQSVLAHHLRLPQ